MKLNSWVDDIVRYAKIGGEVMAVVVRSLVHTLARIKSLKDDRKVKT